MKKTIITIIFMALLTFFLSSCSDTLPETEPPESPSPSVSEKEEKQNSKAEETLSAAEEEDFYLAAKEKGIPLSVAESMADDEIFRNSVTEGYINLSKEDSPEGKYSIRNCYYALSEDTYGTVLYFIENNETGEIEIISGDHFDGCLAGFITEEKFFVFCPFIGGHSEDKTIFFYDAENTKEPFASWQPMNSEIENEKLVFDSVCKVSGKELLCAFWAKVPGGANGTPDVPDPEGCTYMISVIDENGKTKAEYDTGIPVETNRFGYENGTIRSVSGNMVEIEIYEGSTGESAIYVFDISTGKTNKI